MNEILLSVVSGAISFIVGGIITFCITKSKKMIATEKAERNGLRELLKSQLIAWHDLFVEKGYCPLHIKDAATHTYEAYHELGGNGVITGLYQELMDLPVNKKSSGGSKK